MFSTVVSNALGLEIAAAANPTSVVPFGPRPFAMPPTTPLANCDAADPTRLMPADFNC